MVVAGCSCSETGIPGRDLRFESSVVLNGSKTTESRRINHGSFESSVVLNGSKTRCYGANTAQHV